MRRPALIASIVLVAGAWLIRLRRRRAASGSLGGGVPARPLPSPAPALPSPSPGACFVSAPWELVAAPDDEPAVTIRYRGSEHMELDRIDAQETPTQLFVTVLMHWRPQAGGALSFEDEHEAVIPLSRPLGEREVVHAPVDEASDRPLYP